MVVKCCKNLSNYIIGAILHHFDMSFVLFQALIVLNIALLLLVDLDLIFAIKVKSKIQEGSVKLPTHLVLLRKRKMLNQEKSRNQLEEETLGNISEANIDFNDCVMFTMMHPNTMVSVSTVQPSKVSM